MNVVLGRWQKYSSTITATLSIFIGLCVGAIVMAVDGRNPLEAYSVLFKSALATPYDIGSSLAAITPLLLTGLSVAVAFRAGLFNIGAEGQLIVGKLVSFIVALRVPLPGWLGVTVAILAGMLAGMLWGALPGLLKTWRGVHEVISGIMMNFLALYLSNLVITKWLMNPKTAASYPLPAGVTLQSEKLSSWFGHSSLHLGLFFGLAMLAVAYLIIWKTKWGYKLRVVGINNQAARYAGIRVNLVSSLALAAGGALAGLAGAVQVLGRVAPMSSQGAFDGLGFDGIVVALLGAATPLGVLLASSLFGILNSGSKIVESQLGLPNEVMKVVFATILFMIAAKISEHLLRRLPSWKGGAKRRVE